MNISIRHSEKEDIGAIKSIYEQPSCYSGTLQLPYPSLDKWNKFLGSPQENFYSLIAEVDGVVVGQIGMEVYSKPRRKHAANIGMAVSETVQGKGVGSALLSAVLNMANDWVAVKRIELEVYTDNERAINLYINQGFVIEGTAKSYAFRNGQYADVYLMAKVKGSSVN